MGDANIALEEEMKWLIAEMVVVTASKQVETVKEAPVPVTVITSQMIRNIGAKNLKDVLITYVPGMTSSEDQNEINIAQRGVYTSSQQKILVLLNGHRLNARAYSEANPDYSIGLDKIKQIEVLRGPGSSLYGNVALTAVINIITKKGEDINGTEVSVGVGNYGQTKVSFLTGKRFDDENDLFIWGYYYRADGEVVDIPASEDYSTVPKDSTAIVDGVRDLPSYDIGLNYEFGDFTLLASMRYSKYIEPFSAGGSPTGQSYNYDDYATLDGVGPGLGSKFANLGLTFNTDINDTVDLQVNVYHDTNEIQVALITNPSTTSQGYASWNERDSGAAIQLSKSYETDGNGAGNILLGAKIDTMEVYDSKFVLGSDGAWTGIGDSPEDKLLEIGQEAIYSVFAQSKHRFSDKWILNIGIRYDSKDRHKGSGVTATTPRLAVIYIPNQKFDLKVSYAESFVDSPYWYRYNSLSSFRGGEFLEPEKLNAFQVTPSFNMAEGRFRSSFNFFYQELTDFIWRNNNAAADEPIYQNAGFLKSWGVENETSFIEEAYQIRANATYQVADDAENYAVTGDDIHNVPKWTGNLIVDFSPFPKYGDLLMNVTLRYIGEQLSPVNITFGDVRSVYEPDRKIESTFLVNTGFRVNNVLVNNSFIDARIYNLFDEKYYQGGSVTHPYPQPGRWFMISIGKLL
jgi:iron complex outermembrane receptor protein